MGPGTGCNVTSCGTDVRRVVRTEVRGVVRTEVRMVVRTDEREVIRTDERGVVRKWMIRVRGDVLRASNIAS